MPTTIPAIHYAVRGRWESSVIVRVSELASRSKWMSEPLPPPLPGKQQRGLGVWSRETSEIRPPKLLIPQALFSDMVSRRAYYDPTLVKNLTPSSSGVEPGITVAWLETFKHQLNNKIPNPTKMI